MNENSFVLRKALDRKLAGLLRYVLGFATSNDETGHGLTQLLFEDRSSLFIAPGPNDDAMLVAEALPADLNWEFWTLVDMSLLPKWRDVLGKRIDAVEIFADRGDDIALVFELAEGCKFSTLLVDTDLILARDLEPVEHAIERVVPQLRERLEAEK